MRIYLKKLSPRELDHELIWGSVGLAMGIIGLFFPLERVHLRCPFKATTGFACPTCGMTRSFIHLRRLEFAAAFAANPLIAAFAVFAAVYCAYALAAVVFRTRRIRIAPTRPWEPMAIRILALAAVLANWIYLVAVGR